MKKAFFLAVFASVLLLTTKSARADCDQACQLNNQITQYSQKITELQGQANTLSNQIASFNAQIRLTELKVQQTEDQINLLSGRIDQLEVSLQDLNKAFSARAVATYKMSRADEPVYMLFSANDLGDAVSKFHYLQQIQSYDQTLLGRLQSAQDIYKTNKQQSEALQKQLQTQEDQLNAQKASKARLLAETKGSEQTYQNLLAQALAEFQAIQGILAGKGQETQIGHVNEGDRIASIINGPSCNSGGAHLHFTVSQNGVAQNPFSYLKSGVDYINCSGSSCDSSDGDSFNPSGSWNWPISPKIRFNQGYGSTWAVRNTYVGQIYKAHNGIDISSDSSLDVHAVQAGTLYRGVYFVSCSLFYVRVHNDSDGLDDFYLHINY